jgi:hypothetical protein
MVSERNNFILEEQDIGQKKTAFGDSLIFYGIKSTTLYSLNAFFTVST